MKSVSRNYKMNKYPRQESTPISEEEKKKKKEEFDIMAEKNRKIYEEKIAIMTLKELERYNRIMDEEAYRFIDDDE